MILDIAYWAMLSLLLGAFGLIPILIVEERFREVIKTRDQAKFVNKLILVSIIGGIWMGVTATGLWMETMS